MSSRRTDHEPSRRLPARPAWPISAAGHARPVSAAFPSLPYAPGVRQRVRGSRRSMLAVPQACDAGRDSRDRCSRSSRTATPRTRSRLPTILAMAYRPMCSRLTSSAHALGGIANRSGTRARQHACARAGCTVRRLQAIGDRTRVRHLRAGSVSRAEVGAWGIVIDATTRANGASACCDSVVWPARGWPR
jgi:hypothetical protein